MKLYKTALFLLTILFSASFTVTHPLKLTTSLIEYNTEAESLKMECRVFIDDFLLSLERPINLSQPSTAEQKYIEEHFATNYVIMLNNQTYRFKLESSQTMEEQNVFIMKFTIDSININSGDQLCIKNQLFFKDFEFLQSNKVTVRIPTIVKQLYFETDTRRPEVTLNL